MRYVIEVEETVRRINTYTIEVDNENEAEELLDNIGDDINCSEHPDDVYGIIYNSGYEILEYCEGAEYCEYELV